MSGDTEKMLGVSDTAMRLSTLSNTWEEFFQQTLFFKQSRFESLQLSRVE